MININEVIETNRMIEKENLDVRTITVGINLLDCAADTVGETCGKIKEKIVRIAGKLAETAEDIAMEYGIPIVNKRISVTPISLTGASSCRTPEDYVRIALSLDEAAKSYCVDNGYDPAFGARPLKRFIQKNVETLAARIILEGKVREGDTIGLHVDAKTGGLVAEVEKTE